MLVQIWNFHLVRKLAAISRTGVECAIDISRKHLDLESWQLIQIGQLVTHLCASHFMIEPFAVSRK